MASDVEERIRARAHAIWEEEGRPDGRADEHWAMATREVEAAMAAEAPAPAVENDAPVAHKPSPRKPAASRKTAAADTSPKAEAQTETLARKPRSRKTQPA